MVLLRRLDGDDAPWLAQVGRVSLLQSHGHSAPQEVMEAYVDKSFSVDAVRKELNEEQNIFYGVFHNNEPAGYYKIILSRSHSAVPLHPVTYMERLYLLSDYHDLKLGHKLMTNAMELSKTAGEKGMWLTVWQKNEKAIRFYEIAGFTIAAEGKFVLTESHFNPTWVMLLTY